MVATWVMIANSKKGAKLDLLWCILECERSNVLLPSWTFKLIENWGELRIDSKGEVDGSKKRWWREGGGKSFPFFSPHPSSLSFSIAFEEPLRIVKKKRLLCRLHAVTVLERFGHKTK